MAYQPPKQSLAGQIVDVVVLLVVKPLTAYAMNHWPLDGR